MIGGPNRKGYFPPLYLDQRRKKGDSRLQQLSPQVPEFWCNIQLSYDNKFSSIWKYFQVFEEKKIDWDSVIGKHCPICGQNDCYRKIYPYYRNVVTLFPWRSGSIPIARFQCRDKLTTFSLLPHQLAPYYRYTIESMLLAMLLVHQIKTEDGKSTQATLQEFPAESDVTPFRLSCWILAVIQGFRKAHAVLNAWYDFSSLHSEGNKQQWLLEIHAYCRALNPRGPPGKNGSLNLMLQRYSSQTARSLIGIPSQERPLPVR